MDNIYFKVLSINNKELINKLKEFSDLENLNIEVKIIDDKIINNKALDMVIMWWFWSPYHFDLDSDYALKLDNDTLINVDLNELIDEKYFLSNKNTVIAGHQYGPWIKDFYKNTVLMKNIIASKEDREKAVENFSNAGILLINLKRYYEILI